MKTNSEIIAEFHVDLKRNGKMQDALDNLVQKAHASALAEIENLKLELKTRSLAIQAADKKIREWQKECINRDAEIDKLREGQLLLKEIIAKKGNSINTMRTELKLLRESLNDKEDELSQFRDGVGKLKEIINEQKTRCLKERGQCSKDSDGFKHWDELLAHYVSISNLIDEIFLSCAEQPNIEELIGYECKTCNAKVTVHGCADHREATGHNEFKNIYAKPKKDIQNKPISSDQTEQPVCRKCGKKKEEHSLNMLYCIPMKRKRNDFERFEPKTEPKK